MLLDGADASKQFAFPPHSYSTLSEYFILWSIVILLQFYPLYDTFSKLTISQYDSLFQFYSNKDE